MTQKKKSSDKNSAADKKWSTGAKVGAAAVGSAALVAALLYANKKRKDTAPKAKKTTRPKPGQKS